MTLLHAAIFAPLFLATQLTAALAQDATAQSPQQDQMQAPASGGVTDVTGVLGPPGPRFKVEIKDFEVFDETGFDFFGSDEAVFVAKTVGYAVATREFGSLDSNGKVHSFDPDADCVIPAIDTGYADSKWICDSNGAAAPISFTLEAWEQDIHLFGFCTPYGGSTDVVPGAAGFCATESSRASIIGQEHITLDLPTLMSKLPQVGQSYLGNVWLQGGCFKVACGADDIEPRYNVSYMVMRLPDSAGTGGGVVVEP